ncbi:hypothetical protein EGI16_03525 [Chryseobacterium sp. G0240]|uniref:hypothetical protein n=1 Tax=Chryseobacterium sp. G0240 TaxID=2487066 RepID=UPI000F456DCD|nr:hypothetical protein [Chryseobacterium sp. G0240]ROI05469.1 hypothetical protein EGI16_03525 [Chryseobacterium sp. G0240]
MKLNYKEIKEDIISDIAIRLEKEYLYYEVYDDGRPVQNFGSTCLITPPNKGEYYLIHKKNEVVETYIVVNIAHSHSSQEPSYLYLKKVGKIEV